MSKNNTKGKMVNLHQNRRSHFLNPWWILNMKDQTLKFWWFWIALKKFEIKICRKFILEVYFCQFWPSRGILEITKKNGAFLEEGNFWANYSWLLDLQNEFKNNQNQRWLPFQNCCRSCYSEILLWLRNVKSTSLT